MSYGYGMVVWFLLQDRTGRILFKLFDKDPSQFPGSLRTQVRGLWFIFSLFMLLFRLAWRHNNVFGDC